jgi:hypothetical protein
MTPVRFALASLFLCALGFSQAALFPGMALAAPRAEVQSAARDGRHDFDFHFGIWKTHISRLTHSAAGSPKWATLDGTVAVRKIWNGRANLEELEAGGPTGHFEDLGLFVYNPAAHQWSITFAGSNDGALGSPPSVGEFRNGRGEFFDEEIRNGKPVIVRIIWSNIKRDSHDFEQAFSSDGGRTWETDFRASLTRLRGGDPVIPPVASGDPDGQNAFAFAEGKWHERTSRLLHPLMGSKTWIKMDGVSVDKKIWNGRANLVELESDGPKGHLELLSLRLYNPQTRTWNLYFATSPVGVVSDAMTGSFKNGHGVFFSNDTLNGRAIMVRFRVDSFSPTSARSDQAFSSDGGKTWEVNWINDYSRIEEKR